MSPIDINMGLCSRLNSYTGYLLFLLSSGFLVSIGLVIRSMRSRQTPVVDTENTLYDTIPQVQETSSLEKSNLAPYAANILDNSIQDYEFDHPLANNQLTTSAPFTSGFLAARADIEHSENILWQSEVPVMDPTPEHDQRITLECQCASQEGPCNCKSKARGDSHPSSQRPTCAFRELAHHDHIEQFPDEHDPQVFWRRRTMVFGTQP